MSKIKVKNALPKNADGSYPVAIWEKDEAHEATKRTVKGTDGKEVTVQTAEGELYIADDQEHSVVVTGGVSQALAEGRLVEVRGGKEVEYDAEDVAEAAADTGKKK